MGCDEAFGMSFTRVSKTLQLDGHHAVFVCVFVIGLGMAVSVFRFQTVILESFPSSGDNHDRNIPRCFCKRRTEFQGCI